MDSKSSYESSDSNILNKIMPIFFLNMSFGSVRGLFRVEFVFSTMTAIRVVRYIAHYFHVRYATMVTCDISGVGTLLLE